MKKILSILVFFAVLLAFTGCSFEAFSDNVVHRITSTEESAAENTEESVESTPAEAGDSTLVPSSTSEKTSAEKTSAEKTTEKKSTAEKTTAEKTTAEKSTKESTSAVPKTTEEKTKAPSETTEESKSAATEEEDFPDLNGVWVGELDSVIVFNKGFTGHFYASRVYYREGDRIMYDLTYGFTNDNKVYIDDVFSFRIVSPVDTSDLHFVPAVTTNQWIGEVFHRHPELTEADIIQERINNYPQSEATTAPTTTAEKPKGLTEKDLIGTFVGDSLSVIRFYANGKCVYQEPTNINFLNLRRGVNCRYTISGNRFTIYDAADYNLYADVPAGSFVNSFLVKGTSASWSDETFTRSASDNPVNAADERNTYILPSSTRLVTNFDLDHLSKAEVRLARNEILARKGRKFKDAELKAYFENKTWYTGTIDGTTFDGALNKYLNDIELKNVDFINAYEAAH